jgi:hypothetical protein
MLETVIRMDIRVVKHIAINRTAVVRCRAQLQKLITASIVGNIALSPMGFEIFYTSTRLGILLFLP